MKKPVNFNHHSFLSILALKKDFGATRLKTRLIENVWSNTFDHPTFDRTRLIESRLITSTFDHPAFDHLHVWSPHVWSNHVWQQIFLVWVVEEYGIVAVGLSGKDQWLNLGMRLGQQVIKGFWLSGNKEFEIKI